MTSAAAPAAAGDLLNVNFCTPGYPESPRVKSQVAGTWLAKNQQNELQIISYKLFLRFGIAHLNCLHNQSSARAC